MKYKVEVIHGQDQRHIEADQFAIKDGWLIFYRKPPQGGMIEHWRVQLCYVVCMTTEV